MILKLENLLLLKISKFWSLKIVNLFLACKKQVSDNRQLCPNFRDNIVWHFFQRLKTKFRGILFRPLEYRIRGQRGHILHAYRHVTRLNQNFWWMKFLDPKIRDQKRNLERMDLGDRDLAYFPIWCSGGSDCIDFTEELQMASLDIFH